MQHLSAVRAVSQRDSCPSAGRRRAALHACDGRDWECRDENSRKSSCSPAAIPCLGSSSHSHTRHPQAAFVRHASADAAATLPFSVRCAARQCGIHADVLGAVRPGRAGPPRCGRQQQQAWHAAHRSTAARLARGRCSRMSSTNTTVALVSCRPAPAEAACVRCQQDSSFPAAAPICFGRSQAQLRCMAACHLVHASRTGTRALVTGESAAAPMRA